MGAKDAPVLLVMLVSGIVISKRLPYHVYYLVSQLAVQCAVFSPGLFANILCILKGHGNLSLGGKPDKGRRLVLHHKDKLIMGLGASTHSFAILYAIPTSHDLKTFCDISGLVRSVSMYLTICITCIKKGSSPHLCAQKRLLSCLQNCEYSSLQSPRQVNIVVDFEFENS